MLNTKIEYFNNILVSKQYNIIKDASGNDINPKIWYKFDNNNFLLDNQNLVNLTNIRNCSINTTDFIKGNGSIQFTGSSCVESKNTIHFREPNFTISVWAKLTNKENNIKTIAANRAGNNGGWALYVTGKGERYADNIGNIQSNTLVLWFAYNPSLGYWPVAKFLDNYFPKYENIWTHIAIIGKKTGYGDDIECRCYINGILISIVLSTYVNTQNVRFRIGDITDGAEVQFPLNAGSLIDDFRYYNQILNEEQIYELYSGYKRIGEIIETSTTCSIYNSPSGIINQIPNTNMNFNNISSITRINDYVYTQSFGDGNITYDLIFSKFFNDNYIPTNLFLRNNKLSAFTIDNYDENGIYTGIFSTTYNFGLNNYMEKGEFIHITLPTNIILKRYGFRADNQWVSRAPGTWSLYTGTNLIWNHGVKIIPLVKNQNRLSNNNYCSGNLFTYIHDISNNTNSGNELLFIFTSLASSTSVNNPGRVLSFMEILLFS